MGRSRRHGVVALVSVGFLLITVFTGTARSAPAPAPESMTQSETAAVIADFEDAMVSNGAFEDFFADNVVITMVEVAEEAPAPIQAYVPAATAPQEATPAPVLDNDLVEIFMAEAAELIENLDKSFNAWQGNSHNVEALREMQHALHTLKGGARMAGLEVMGTAAHDMESRLNVHEHSPGAANAEALALMTERKITQLFVVAEGGHAPIGVLHIHDCLRAGLT